MPDRLAIPDKLRPSVLVGREKEKDQDEDRNGPSGIPRKAERLIISEKNEGEFVMLQPVPPFKVLINRIGHRNPMIASYQPTGIRFHRLLIFYNDTSSRGQAPETMGLLSHDHPFSIGEKTGLRKGEKKE
jgi:hypothetical protein